jgi:hypothetical protein
VLSRKSIHLSNGPDSSKSFAVAVAKAKIIAYSGINTAKKCLLYTLKKNLQSRYFGRLQVYSKKSNDLKSIFI